MMEYLVSFWNLENLFGPESHPHRIDWVKKDLKNSLVGWTQSMYERKLEQLSKVICNMNGIHGPDILGVCEVEDHHVLGDLVSVVNSKLAARDYHLIYATNDLSARGIDTAIIYDKNVFTVDANLIFNHFVMRRTGTRDILQATFKSVNSGKELVVIANHWPSRYGGSAEASAGFRATAGETLSYWHTRIREESADKDRTPVIALGDLNDDPWDHSVQINALATRERGDIERAQSARFYNLSWEYLISTTKDINNLDREIEGSLYYKNNGNHFDQILVNRPLIDGSASSYKFVDNSAGLILFKEMVSHRKGEGPIRFGLPKGKPEENINLNGYSDHFPIGLRVKE